VLALSRRYLEEEIKDRDLLTSPKVTRVYLKARLPQGSRPSYTTRHARSSPASFSTTATVSSAYEELFQGTTDGASVHPREVVRCALELHAAAVILAHNHPSGNTEPSQADLRITQHLQKALALVDVWCWTT